jgi:hypothetical protein
MVLHGVGGRRQRLAQGKELTLFKWNERPGTWLT